MGITIEQIDKSYGTSTIIKDLSLTIQKGELISLLGPSGSGKTTLLRIIAGLEHADRGKIFFEGIDQTNTHVKERKVGFVFQHYALFQNMTVFDNIAYGLRVRPRKERPTKKQIAERVNELLEVVKLTEWKDRYPARLSGGQRQRVALARALAVNPKVLLLDEPFGALDAKVRKELRRWLRKVHDEFQITSVFVTHDQEEALDISDRVVIMNEGEIEQIGTPEEVYDRPATPFVYDFLGNVNQFSGKISEGYLLDGTIKIQIPKEVDKSPGSGVAYARPHRFSISKEHSGEHSIHSVVLHVQKLGPIVRLELQRKDTNRQIHVELSEDEFAELKLEEGEEVFATAKELTVFSS